MPLLSRGGGYQTLDFALIEVKGILASLFSFSLKSAWMPSAPFLLPKKLEPNGTLRLNTGRQFERH